MTTGNIFVIIAIATVAIMLSIIFYGYWIQIQRITIYDYQKGLLYKNGKFIRTLGAGRYWSLTSGTDIIVEDLREQSIIVPGQEMLTSDQLTVKASAVVRYKIVDLRKAHENFSDIYSRFYTDIQIALRQAMVKRTLEDILSESGDINAELKDVLAGTATELGQEITGVQLRDLMMSRDTKRSFSDVFRARKEGEAALERARGETAALRSLANGARMMKNNPALYNLRVLQLLADPSTTGKTIILNTSGEPLDPTSLALGEDEDGDS